MADVNKDDYLLEYRITEILKRIEALKSVIAGRNIDFTIYTHSSQPRPVYSPQKTKEFILHLNKHVAEYYKKNNISYTLSNEQFYSLFFYLTINYLLIACNPDDCIFESFLKLAGTIDKPNSKQESVFDVLLNDLFTDYRIESSDLKEIYKEFNALFDQETCYIPEVFSQAIRYSINSFLDSENISYYIHEENYNHTIFLLEQALDSLISLRD